MLALNAAIVKRKCKWRHYPSQSRSEQISADQLRVFAQELGIAPALQERDQGGDDQNPEPPSPPATGSSDKRKRRGRQALPRHLKRQRMVHDLADAEKHCAECDQHLRHIGEQVSERYEYISGGASGHP